MCVCVCGLQILSFNVVEFISTVGCGSGPETVRFPYGYRCKYPLFECYFSEIVDEFFTKIIEKGADKKKEQTSSSKIRGFCSDLDAGRDQILDS